LIAAWRAFDGPAFGGRLRSTAKWPKSVLGSRCHATPRSQINTWTSWDRRGRMQVIDRSFTELDW